MYGDDGCGCNVSNDDTMKGTNGALIGCGIAYGIFTAFGIAVGIKALLDVYNNVRVPVPIIYHETYMAYRAVIRTKWAGDNRCVELTILTALVAVYVAFSGAVLMIGIAGGLVITVLMAIWCIGEAIATNVGPCCATLYGPVAAADTRDRIGVAFDVPPPATTRSPIHQQSAASDRTLTV